MHPRQNIANLWAFSTSLKQPIAWKRNLGPGTIQWQSEHWATSCSTVLVWEDHHRKPSTILLSSKIAEYSLAFRSCSFAQKRPLICRFLLSPLPAQDIRALFLTRLSQSAQTAVPCVSRRHTQSEDSLHTEQLHWTHCSSFASDYPSSPPNFHIHTEAHRLVKSRWSSWITASVVTRRMTRLWTCPFPPPDRRARQILKWISRATSLRNPWYGDIVSLMSHFLVLQENFLKRKRIPGCIVWMWKFFLYSTAAVAISGEHCSPPYADRIWLRLKIDFSLLECSLVVRISCFRCDWRLSELWQTSLSSSIAPFITELGSGEPMSNERERARDSESHCEFRTKTLITLFTFLIGKE